MTIEDITYYIEKDMEEGFYGADCDLREMAHIEVLELLKELRAHREAWEKVSKRINLWKQDSERLDSLYAIGRIEAFKKSLEIIAEYRPKEGENE